MKKILFIGEISKSSEIPNGVNIKNNNFIEYLENIYKLTVINTRNWKYRPYIYFQILLAVFMNPIIILSLNSKSAYRTIRILHYLYPRKRILYIVAGGNLIDLIKNGSFKLRYYKRLYKIFLQTQRLVEEASRLGLENTEHLPNSKSFSFIPDTKNRKSNEGIRCFYLGRITPEKGIAMIFSALSVLNKDSTKLSVDFFGPISPGYKKEFLSMLSSRPKDTKYMGILDFRDHQSYALLNSYDLFLFPTFWHGEGFPGVVLDSFISGVPVLASDWHENPYIIREGSTGFLFKTNSLEDFVAKIEYISHHKHILSEMRENAYQEALKYKSEEVISTLYKHIE